MTLTSHLIGAKVEPNPFPIDSIEALGTAMIAAADAAGIGVVVVSFRVPEPQVLFASATASEILGIPAEDLVGRAALSLAALDELPRLRNLHAESGDDASRDWHVVFETTAPRTDGRQVHIEVTASEAELDGQSVVVAFIGDISRERSVQEKLARAEARFRRLIESAPEAIWIHHEEAVLYANLAAVRLFGYENFDQIRGKSPLAFIRPPDVSQYQRRTSTQLETREVVPRGEYRAARADGSTILLEVSSIPGDYEGEPAVYCFGRDVTERRQIESQLLQADRLGVLGLLAGGMAHAINNPLTYVLLNVDHLLHTLPDLTRNQALLGEALTRLREAHHGAERVAAVVRRMRAFSRPSERDAGPVDVREVLESAVAMVGNEIRHRGRLLTTYQVVPPVHASVARLEQVFLNLLVCAAQSLPEGEEQGAVRVALSPGGEGRVVVEVSDDGPGLDPQVVRRIYDPFVNRDAMSDRMGLGLSLCHSIITSIGGSFQIESTVGVGTTFRLELPAVLRDQGSDSPPTSRRFDSEPPPMPLPRARVVVIDDDQAVANSLRLMLEDEHDVRSVASGREALTFLLHDEDYDVVFCDLMMPDVSGMDLYEALRLNTPGREQRLVFMTGGAFTLEAVSFLNTVPNPRIEKPFDLESVRRLLRRAVRQSGRR